VNAPAGRHGWIDATLPLAADSVAWTGLPTPRLTWKARIAEGASVNVGQLDCSLHTGTHTDAPLHVRDGAAPVDRLDPLPFLGPALLVRTADRSAITLAELEALGVADARPARLLIATPEQYDGVHFPTRIPHLDGEAADWLAREIGVRLVGVNVPSVDPLDSRDLPAHHALFRGGAMLVENLQLAGLPAGRYELAAPPLAITCADAAPLRALVRPLD
jgi:arylformamidase